KTPTGMESSTGEPPGWPTNVREALCAASGRRHDLAGVEDTLRIERLLQRAHGVERLVAEFGLEVFLLALPDAVLAGAGAAHRLRALHQPVHEILAARHLLAVVDV